MSDPSAIGFIVDGELKISYERRGMALQDYTPLLQFVEHNSVEAMKKRARNMTEVDSGAYAENGKLWSDVSHYSDILGDSPMSKFYIDGRFIAYNRDFCVSIAIFNLDDEVLEIYLSDTYSDVWEGRFVKDPKQGGEAVNLFRVIPFTNMPESSDDILDELYEQAAIQIKKKYSKIV